MSEADDEAPESELEEQGEREDEDEDPPTVVLTRLADLGRYVPDALRKSFGDRPVWFIREDDQELVEIFEHLPEDPMPKGRAHEILRGIRAFAEESSDRLQEVLGVAEGIVYGFHGDATLQRVTAAFEEDGFIVCAGIVQAGEIVVPEA
jgi:hypothetical protein